MCVLYSETENCILCHSEDKFEKLEFVLLNFGFGIIIFQIKYDWKFKLKIEDEERKRLQHTTKKVFNKLKMQKKKIKEKNLGFFLKDSTFLTESWDGQCLVYWVNTFLHFPFELKINQLLLGRYAFLPIWFFDDFPR